MDLDLSSKKERKQYIWVEKYRPSTLSNYIGNNHIISTFQKFIENQDIPHLLFYGSPGSGKTTISKILVNSISCDSLYINASDENGVEVIRDKVKSFASSCGFNSLKVIILDEADGITPDSQRILRGVMEMYSLHTRFILTCNYLERIIEALISRCQCFQLIPPSKKDIAIYIVNLLKNENISYKDEDLVSVINTYNPDIRKMIQYCQQASVSGKLQITKTDLVENDIKVKILDMLKSRVPFLEIRKFVVENDIRKFEEIYDFLFEKVDEFALGKQSSVILDIANGLRSELYAHNKQIMFLACICEIYKTLKVN